MQRIGVPARAAAAILAIFFAASSLLAYNVKLKDGSIIFARTKYEVKGKKAIITLQNGTVTSYDLDLIDIPGTEQYNKENPYNALVVETGGDRSGSIPVVTRNPQTTLQDVISRRSVKLNVPSARKEEAAAISSTQVDASVDQAFRKTLDGAGISQYRLSNLRGKTRFLATTNTEEAVFNTLSAVARVLTELAGRGRDVTVEIVLTTSSGDGAGSFEMSPEQARLVVNGNLPIADYFLKNVIL